MKLQQQQKNAISLLKKHNNIIVLAPRRSGKTFLAKYIIENNKDKKIGIVTNINPEVYVKYKNVSKYKPNKKYDLVIGDEEIVLSDKNKTISLGTYRKSISILSEPFKDVVIVRWSLKDCPWFGKEELKRIKKIIPKELLESEYFIKN
jgi:AAA+ ATPase superfamily predicted ATPase